MSDGAGGHHVTSGGHAAPCARRRWQRPRGDVRGHLHHDAAAGACRSGIIQQANVDDFTVGETGSVACETLNIGCNESNSHVTCVMGQAAKMDTKLKQYGQSVAKNEDPFMAVAIILIALVLLLLMAPFILGGILKIIDNAKNAAFQKHKHGTEKDMLVTEEANLKMLKLHAAVAETAAKTEAQLHKEGVPQDVINQLLHIHPHSQQASANPHSA